MRHLPVIASLIVGSVTACTVDSQDSRGSEHGGASGASAPRADAGPNKDEDASAEIPKAFAYKVTLSDPENRLTAAHADMVACLEAALDEWGKYLAGKGTLSVELLVGATATNRMSGASTSSLWDGACKSMPACTVAQAQAIHRLRTGKSNEEGQPDIRVTVSPDYWTRLLWVDPKPAERTAAVPPDRLDAISVFTHELGHGLGIAGYRSLDTYLPTDAPVILSAFDDLVVASVGALTFEGPKTKAALGPIPLTRNARTENIYHYGDPQTRSAYDAALMNGIVFDYATRYRVGRVDIRILDDLGVALRGPVPPS